jgi:metaxin
VPFPLNHMLPKKIHLESINRLKQTGLLTKEQAYVLARDGYAALNAKLAASSGAYFFGDRVSALDAAVFGHTVDALGDPQLCKAVYQYAPLLVTHAEHVRDVYFGCSTSGERPRALSLEQLQHSYYSQNHDNAFAQHENASFMHQVPPALQVAFLEPYRSLNWSRRELLSEVAAKQKHDKQQDKGETEGEAAEGFDKSTRNVIIGAVAAIILYALANLPVRINLLGEDDGEEGDDDDEEDDEHYYYEEEE